MAFGIRVPGVRISTRGVRVGPRFANVGVSRRGRVSGTFGPRVARVSVSGRGVRAATGVGPIGVSGGSGGIRLFGGVGPTFGAVGSGGIVGGVGAGPVWVAKGIRFGRPELMGAPRARMDLSSVYRAYKEEIVRSGSSRRTRDELRIAAVNALFAPVDYLVVPFAPFEPPRLSPPDDSDLRVWARCRAIQNLVDRGVVSRAMPDLVHDDHDARAANEVRRRLVSQAVDRPVHPARWLGVAAERRPTVSEIRQWAEWEARRQLPRWNRLVRPRALIRLVDELERRKRDELPALVKKWEDEIAEFDHRLSMAVESRSEHEDADNLARRREVRELSAAVEIESGIVRESQVAALNTAYETFERFQRGDVDVVTVVLQAVMSDNAGAAAPVGFDNGDLLVLMTAPAPHQVIWPERVSRVIGFSVAPKTNSDILDDYETYLFCHAVSTARECAVTSEYVRRVRVVIFDASEEEDDLVFDRRVVSVLTVNTDQVLGETSGSDVLATATAAVDAGLGWQADLLTGDVKRLLDKVAEIENNKSSVVEILGARVASLRVSLAQSFVSYVRSAGDERPRLVDLVEGDLLGEREVQLLEADDNDISGALDVEAGIVQSVDFWILCGFLARKWNDDEVDIEEVVQSAAALASFLHPFSASDISWSAQRN